MCGNLDREALSSNLLGATKKQVSDIFDSEDWSLFRSLSMSANFFAEWGSGLSTFYAASQKSIRKVVSVETDPVWADKVRSFEKEDAKKIELRLVDFGTVKAWGRPTTYSKIKNVWEYSSAPFQGGYKPDLILVDGRFRVHCFLVALLKAEPGTRIIFEDYVNRHHYHIVERFVSPTEIRGKQALFTVDTRLLDRPRINSLSKKFSYVMD